MRALVAAAVLFAITACASRPVAPRANVTVAAADDLSVRRYRLGRVPGLVASMLRQRLDTEINLEITLRNATYTTAVATLQSGSQDPRATIDWFVLDYIARDPASGKVATGQMIAPGPEPESFGSIEVEERAVVTSAVSRLEYEIARTLKRP